MVGEYICVCVCVCARESLNMLEQQQPHGKGLQVNGHSSNCIIFLNAKLENHIQIQTKPPRGNAHVNLRITINRMHAQQSEAFE